MAKRIYKEYFSVCEILVLGLIHVHIFLQGEQKMSSLNIKLRILYSFLLEAIAIKFLTHFPVNDHKDYFNKDLSIHAEVSLSSSKTPLMI